MKLKRSIISLQNLQVKNLEKAKQLAKALAIIEENCGIHEVKIEIDGFFVCPWIDLTKMQNNPMEKLLADLFIKSKAV